MFDYSDSKATYIIRKDKFIESVKPKLDLYFSFSDRADLSQEARAQLSGFANDLEFKLAHALYNKITGLQNA